MSKNLHSVQLMTIPAPLFDFGDFVEWSLTYGLETVVYRGTVESRSWNEDEPNSLGQWDYGLRCIQVLRNGTPKSYHNYDSVQESDLKPWERSKTDTEIDSSIDTGTDTKWLTNASMPLAI